MITVLLDTNILIALEDPDRLLDARCAEMLRNASPDIDFYYHPIQLRDIERDRDEGRRAIFTSKINRYKPLNQAPTFSEDYFAEKGWSNNSDNDYIDNTLLACVVEPCVNYLVTNDKGILSKARKTEVDDRVLDLESFEDLIGNRPEPPELACVKEEQCHVLDIRDPFFDSLRKGYQTFDKWLEGCAREQRKCWTIRKNERLAALCIYKSEESSIIDDEGFRPKGPILKLCTFKVDSGTYGQKMGERLLHMAFSYATQCRFNFVYLTVHEEEHPELVELMQSFGFVRYGRYQRRDLVLGKYLRPQTLADRCLPKLEFVERFYPFFKDGKDVGKFLIPIQDKYHERLFPDISNLKYSLLGDLPEMYGPESNTIRKAYLCTATISKIEPGDLLLFYRSIDRSSIEVLGVVKEIRRLTDREQIQDMVRGRTVYASHDIDRMVELNPGGILVICFDLVQYFNKPVTLEQMHGLGLTHPQSICELSNEKYTAIMEASK